MAVMSMLPGVLAPVRAAVASLLLPIWHANRPYSADDITVILNIAADVADGARADATLLLRLAARLCQRDLQFIRAGIQQLLWTPRPGRHRLRSNWDEAGAARSIKSKMCLHWTLRIDGGGKTSLRRPVEHGYCQLHPDQLGGLLGGNK